MAIKLFWYFIFLLEVRKNFWLMVFSDVQLIIYNDKQTRLLSKNNVKNYQQGSTSNRKPAIYCDLIVCIERGKFEQQITSSSSVARMNLSKFLHKFYIIAMLNYGVKVVLTYCTFWSIPGYERWTKRPEKAKIQFTAMQNARRRLLQEL